MTTDGSLQDLATSTGFDRKSLYRYAEDSLNPSGEHRDPPARAIVPLTNATRRYDIIEFLCDQVGGVFVLRPTMVAAPADLVARVAALTHEVGDVQHAAAAALTDGMVPEEARYLEAQLAELAREVEATRLAVARRPPLTKAAAR
jgi:hypothetical protein